MEEMGRNVFNLYINCVRFLYLNLTVLFEGTL